MADLQLQEMEQLKAANADLVSASSVVKQKNIILEKRHQTNTDRIKTMHAELQELKENYRNLQVQKKQEINEMQDRHMESERELRRVTIALEETQQEFEEYKTKAQADLAQLKKEHDNELLNFKLD